MPKFGREFQQAALGDAFRAEEAKKEAALAAEKNLSAAKENPENWKKPSSLTQVFSEQDLGAGENEEPLELDVKKAPKNKNRPN